MNLQDSHYSLTLNIVGQVLHKEKQITSRRKYIFHWLRVKESLC